MEKYFVLDYLFIYCTWSSNLRNTKRYEITIRYAATCN